MLASIFLEEFDRRIVLGVSDVLPAVFLVYACAGVTVALQTIRAAVASPVDALKYE